ncbi:prolyl oligopeptidase family serine peptidase [Verrucomicrobium spinosum]|uniref:prolyl oligopeptidase family serine peptidase n=1 Tax=Verrucomicrobium spinosum TaxID=2736 RepID=UPI00017452A6|nr:prolyl oligopeptidase family serine peptidase [Verrucomicrobium spinosum]
MKPSASILLALALATLSAGSAFADGPKDNIITNVRPIPPVGVEVPQADREAIEKGLQELKAAIEDAKKAQAKNPQLADLLPDVEVFHKAVDWALRYQLFSKPPEIKLAFEQLTEGKSRAEALKKGDAPWTRQKGLVVRAYRSRIDGSVQPYGLVIPDSYDTSGGAPVRLDFWIHGRGETLSELSFVDQRMKQKGQILPKDAIVLHPYGRYCCANKFAGEVDLFEALEHAKKFYRIDEDRIVMRGFSMGGAAAWQFATHFSDQWCAANPGAGFAETAEFLKVFQTEDVNTVPWWHKKLWGWYDATDYALNLMQCPTVAYSGEIDKQKQAADIMDRFLKAEGLDLTHIIGPQTAHKIHPDSLVEIERRLADIVALGRNRTPAEVHFATKTLRYNRINWVTVDGLEEHWEKGRVDAVVKGDASVEVKTSKITALTLNFDAGHSPFHLQKKVTVTLDGTPFTTSTTRLDRSFTAAFQKKDGKWQIAETTASAPAGVLAKRHGLSGPVDDAFMDAFLFVTPTGPALNPAVEKWVGSELNHAVVEWQKQFRGDAPQKKDTEVKDEDIARHNLILWGDPSSNAVLKKIADKLPIKWTAEGLEVNGKKHAAGENAPVLVYPNPLNPARYVVINSSFTYREYDYLNNARQVPKLPDWAVVNFSEAPNVVSPGKITDAGFFNEAWQWKPAPAAAPAPAQAAPAKP